HEDTQLYGAILPKELTNEDIRNSESYNEYYEDEEEISDQLVRTPSDYQTTDESEK
ncbi:hypothetical protein Tco_0521256, partial [Tanacetum coccineum]